MNFVAPRLLPLVSNDPKSLVSLWILRSGVTVKNVRGFIGSFYRPPRDLSLTYRYLW